MRIDPRLWGPSDHLDGRGGLAQRATEGAFKPTPGVMAGSVSVYALMQTVEKPRVVSRPREARRTTGRTTRLRRHGPRPRRLSAAKCLRASRHEAAAAVCLAAGQRRSRVRHAEPGAHRFHGMEFLIYCCCGGRVAAETAKTLSSSSAVSTDLAVTCAKPAALADT
jgi:hypothetical protein